MTAGELATVIGLLAACLVALALVLIARREAAALRSRALADAQSVHEEARAKLRDLERREMRLADREAAISADVTAATEQQRLARQDIEEARNAQRKAERALDSAERAATRTLADAERHAAKRLADAQAQALAELESVSGLNAQQAREMLSQQVIREAEVAAATRVRRVEAQTRRSADAKARRILTTAVQRLAGPTTTHLAVTTVQLPSEEFKGRIVGKEGRNIRAFEALTGVNILIDEGPDLVALSCFDPDRRELGAATLATLLEDGRINPQRIETAYAQAQQLLPERVLAAGHDAAERAGVDGLADEVVEVLGRLRLRTSAGQNVLEHLVECAQVAAALAAEIGADVHTARRAAFLHDIGKALTDDNNRSHALAGAHFIGRYGESPAVVNAVAAHHDELPVETVEGFLVQVADTISATRPGARRESSDQFAERMERLEKIVGAYPGVRRVLAMAAGREVRVVVEPDEVSDESLPGLAQTIAHRIETEGEVPGEIRVTVVRELRASATTH